MDNVLHFNNWTFPSDSKEHILKSFDMARNLLYYIQMEIANVFINLTDTKDNPKLVKPKDITMDKFTSFNSLQNFIKI